MELRQLKYFLAVAHEGTFGRAADALRVAQPALSRQIQKLELELGTQLFVRHPHGVSVTPAGLKIQLQAERILDEVRQLRRSVQTPPRELTGKIKLAASPGAAEILAYPMLRMVAQRHPALRCEIVSILMPAREKTLTDENVAFALMNDLSTTGEFTKIPVIREQLCVLCRADDDRFSTESIDLEALSKIPLIIGGPHESGVRSLLNVAFNRAHLDLNVAAEVNTAGAAKAMVLEGFGPTVQAAAMARSELLRGELRAIPISAVYLTRVIAIPKQTKITPLIEQMIDTTCACITDLVESGRWLNGEIVKSNWL